MIDWGIVIAVAMLVVWAFGTLQSWPGWIHALLTAGVSLLIWRIVQRSAKPKSE